jgi:hypothetical protein
LAGADAEQIPHRPKGRQSMSEDLRAQLGGQCMGTVNVEVGHRADGGPPEMTRVSVRA